MFERVVVIALERSHSVEDARFERLVEQRFDIALQLPELTRHATAEFDRQLGEHVRALLGCLVTALPGRLGHQLVHRVKMPHCPGTQALGDQAERFHVVGDAVHDVHRLVAAQAQGGDQCLRPAECRAPEARRRDCCTGCARPASSNRAGQPGLYASGCQASLVVVGGQRYTHRRTCSERAFGPDLATVLLNDADG